MKRISILLLLFFLAADAVHSQSYQKFFWGGLDLNKPLSNTDFVKDVSTRGFKVGFRQLLDEHLLVGVDLNSASYKGYTPRQTYTSANGALTTDFHNYAYVYGLTLAGDYLFNPEKKFQPYVGFGLGASYVDYTLYYNVFSDNDPKWGVLLRPEAGVLLQLGKYSSWGIQAGMHFDFATAKSKDYGYNNFSNVGFQIGVVLFDW
jgi:opacity protein-like surface antigen